MSNAVSFQTGHVLNVAPLELAGGPVQAERLRYVDANWLRELRNRTRETHVVRRELRTDTVVCVPLKCEAASLGGSTEIIDLKKDLYLAASLIRNALLAYLNSIKRTVLHLRPVTFLANGESDDYFAAALPQGVKNHGQLRVSPVFELDVRVISPEDQPAYVAIIFDGFVSRRILANCTDLIRDGVEVRGVYVKRIAETNDLRLAPKLETVGQVASINGDTLTLTDHREDTPTILASEAYPQARGEFFDRCVRAIFPRHASMMLTCIEQARANFRQGGQLLDRLSSIRSHLGKQRLPLPQGVTLKLDFFLASAAKNDLHPFPKVYRARSPVYLFDSATSSKACEWPVDAGITRYGPYSSRGFTPNRPRVCVLCQKAKKGQVEQFLVKFKEGVVTGGDGIQPFEQGFLDKYHLSGIDFEFFVTETNTGSAYRKAARSAIASVGPGGHKWDICFVQIEERFKDLPNAENPYLICKSELLTHQMPVQAFTVETMELSAYSIQYALNNFSLACYAKMNGTPWLLKSDQPLLQEMVVGLGSARIGDSRLGSGQRVVGITTVFTGDGNYCLSNLSRAASFETYQDELLETLRLAVRQVRADTGWQCARPVRLVFHAFKPFRDAEITAVMQVMEDLGEFNAEFAFVHVIEDHPYRLFDLDQQGKPDKRTRSTKGVYGPNRGLFMLLSEREVLLTLTGFKEVKRPEDGVPRPILLRIHENSTFTDPVYLARQICTFAGHSWQGFFPCDMPVTIEYSAMIAKLLGNLATLPGWNPSSLLGNIGWTRWFL
ncbi:argonaute/piwi family protein [Zavarzinella formosa]|uniref:argonaute/piwi family protein n=1 Tax=Zavarzinella formosa TaxID=360055 RepID=UPI0003709FC7|nr:hypothetical protein [Zavarzinella formosa]